MKESGHRSSALIWPTAGQPNQLSIRIRIDCLSLLRTSPISQRDTNRVRKASSAACERRNAHTLLLRRKLSMKAYMPAALASRVLKDLQGRRFCLSSLELIFLIPFIKTAKLSVQRPVQFFSKVLILLAKLALALIKVCMRCIDGGIDHVIVETSTYPLHA